MKKLTFVVLTVCIFTAVSWIMGTSCGNWFPDDWGINFHSSWCVKPMIFPKLQLGENSDGFGIYAFSSWGVRMGGLARWVIISGILLLIMDRQTKTKSLAKIGAIIFLFVTFITLASPTYYFAVWRNSLIFWPIWTATTGWYNIFPTLEIVWKITTVVIVTAATWPMVRLIPKAAKNLMGEIKDMYN